jgi:hypothetical protein
LLAQGGIYAVVQIYSYIFKQPLSPHLLLEYLVFALKPIVYVPCANVAVE